MVVQIKDVNDFCELPQEFPSFRYLPYQYEALSCSF